MSRNLRAVRQRGWKEKIKVGRYLAVKGAAICSKKNLTTEVAACEEEEKEEKGNRPGPEQPSLTEKLIYANAPVAS